MSRAIHSIRSLCRAVKRSASTTSKHTHRARSQACPLCPPCSRWRPCASRAGRRERASPNAPAPRGRVRVNDEALARQADFRLVDAGTVAAHQHDVDDGLETIVRRVKALAETGVLRQAVGDDVRLREVVTSNPGNCMGSTTSRFLLPTSGRVLTPGAPSSGPRSRDAKRRRSRQ